MLIAGLFLILVLAAIAAYVLKRYKVRMGYMWMTLSLSALIVWFMLMFIPYERSVFFMVPDWYGAGSALLELSFMIKPSNWPVVFALITLHAFFLFTAATQPGLNRDFLFWIVETAEVALTYAVLTSANLITLILAWTVLDVLGLFFHILMRGNRDVLDVFYPFIFKLAGGLLLLLANAKIVGAGQSALLESLPVSSSTMIFFSAVLHSGILPYRPFRQGKSMVVTIVEYFTYFLPFTSSMFLVTYLPAPNLPLIPGNLLALFFMVIFVYFSSRWLSKKEIFPAIHSIQFSFIGILGFLFFTNAQVNRINWFVVLILCMNYLLLYYRHSKSLQIFNILLLLTLTGLPFSLVDYSSSGFTTITSILSTLTLMAFHVVFNVGFLYLFFKEKEKFEELEASYQLVYMVGLGLALLSLGVITFRTLGSLMDELSGWWAGVLVTLVSLGIYFRQIKKGTEHDGWDEQSPLDKKVVNVLTFHWFQKVSDHMVQIIRVVVSAFSRLLEGEGGVLWSLVFLALLFTLLKIG